MSNTEKNANLSPGSTSLHKIKSPAIHTYQYGEYPELVHFVKMGIKLYYHVLYEDAYGVRPWTDEAGNPATVVIMTKKEIEEKFKITLDE